MNGQYVLYIILLLTFCISIDIACVLTIDLFPTVHFSQKKSVQYGLLQHFVSLKHSRLSGPTGYQHVYSRFGTFAHCILFDNRYEINLREFAACC